ncbi:MAG: hypothetical protein AUJ19_03195 [Parcubacteria group bacterium CG1_02_58_44]|nr:MAG: hypothetical protein AUJ19_03195 [Parcubacteria group bacterium CG1_02_58_44]
MMAVCLRFLIAYPGVLPEDPDSDTGLVGGGPLHFYFRVPGSHFKLDGFSPDSYFNLGLNRLVSKLSEILEFTLDRTSWPFEESMVPKLNANQGVSDSWMIKAVRRHDQETIGLLPIYLVHLVTSHEGKGRKHELLIVPFLK